MSEPEAMASDVTKQSKLLASVYRQMKTTRLEDATLDRCVNDASRRFSKGAASLDGFAAGLEFFTVVSSVESSWINSNTPLVLIPARSASEGLILGYPDASPALPTAKSAVAHGFM